MVRAEVGVFHRGAAEFRQRDDDEIVPGRLVGVFEEVFAKGVDRPGNAALQVGMRTGHSALRAVRVEAAHFGAGDDGGGVVQNERGRLEVVEESVRARVHDILLGVGHSAAAVPAAVLCVGRGKQIITTGGGIRPSRVCVGGRVVAECVASLGEIERGKSRKRVAEVLVLEAQQLAVFLVGKRKAVGSLDRVVCFLVAGTVRNAEQIVAVRIAEIRHRRGRTAQDQRQAGLKRNTGEWVAVGQAGLHHRAVQNAVFHHVIVGVARLPIVLRIEVRAGLLRITDAVNERQVAGVVHRREKFQRRVQRGKPITQPDGVRVAERRVRRCRVAREVTWAGHRVVG